MAEAPVTRLTAAAYRIPTDAPEADGTIAWDATTMVVVEVEAGGTRGLGYTYASAGTVAVIRDTLAAEVEGRSAFDIPAHHAAMRRAVRNLGGPGVAASALSAVDTALWDLKARLLGVPLARLLGQRLEAVPLYGSGGFTTYDEGRLTDQLGGWAAQGFAAVKMKVGADPAADPARVAAARRAVGPEVALMVDANGALGPFEALAAARDFSEEGVVWFEEPVSSDDLAGLARVRGRAPPGMAVAAGEYGYDPWYFRRMLEARAVDVLQADATRCGGITGFLQAAALAEAFHLPISAHCAPALHLAPCAAAGAAHLEWFHDHVRIESLVFDGAPRPQDGKAVPGDAPGLGLTLRRPDAERFAV